MRQPIEDEKGARRLARAIVSDINLYDEAELARGDGVPEAIAEGRLQFDVRVAPRWHDVFEEELAKLVPVTCLRAAPPGTEPRPPEPGAPEAPATGMSPTPRSRVPSGRSRVPLIIAVLALLATAAFVLWRLQ